MLSSRNQSFDLGQLNCVGRGKVFVDEVPHFELIDSDEHSYLHSRLSCFRALKFWVTLKSEKFITSTRVFDLFALKVIIIVVIFSWIRCLWNPFLMYLLSWAEFFHRLFGIKSLLWWLYLKSLKTRFSWYLRIALGTMKLCEIERMFVKRGCTFEILAAISIW